MTRSSALAKLAKLALVAGLAALVRAWFRSRAEITEDPVPGSAQWPPLRVVEPANGSAAAPAAEVGVSDDADPAGGDGGYVRALADGSCPASHPVKAKDSSRIYHTPDGVVYDRTNADRCYATPAAAEADGYRRSKR